MAGVDMCVVVVGSFFVGVLGVIFVVIAAVVVMRREETVLSTSPPFSSKAFVTITSSKCGRNSFTNATLLLFVVMLAVWVLPAVAAGMFEFKGAAAFVPPFFSPSCTCALSFVREKVML